MKLFLSTPNPSGYKDRIEGLICQKAEWVEVVKGGVVIHAPDENLPRIAQELRDEGFL